MFTCWHSEILLSQQNTYKYLTFTNKPYILVKNPELSDAKGDMNDSHTSEGNSTKFVQDIMQMSGDKKLENHPVELISSSSAGAYSLCHSKHLSKQFGGFFSSSDKLLY